jgi:hypothetical protein
MPGSDNSNPYRSRVYCTAPMQLVWVHAMHSYAPMHRLVLHACKHVGVCGRSVAGCPCPVLVCRTGQSDAECDSLAAEPMYASGHAKQFKMFRGASGVCSHMVSLYASPNWLEQGVRCTLEYCICCLCARKVGMFWALCKSNLGDSGSCVVHAVVWWTAFCAGGVSE